MKEFKQIIDSYELLKVKAQACALATVVHVEGSAYRRPGARMLITDDGRLTGAISGGCLEGDALKKALLVINNGVNSLVTYDTMDEDDAIIGVGLGCNGIIKVLIEAINFNDENNPIELIKAALSRRQSCVLLTTFSNNKDVANEMGTNWLANESGMVKGISNETQITFNVKNNIEKVFTSKENLWLNDNQQGYDINYFYEFISPVISLVIIGGGNDVFPLVEMASVLGWETKIVDGRANYATSERFPSACTILVAKAEQVLDKINIDEYTVFALMTHNYVYDKTMLHFLSQLTQIPYIGLLGPKKKFLRILSEYEAEGRALSESQLSNIYAPIGLHIGAETPEEIALSIIAEIKMVLSNKQGNSLRLTADKIH